MLLDIVVVAVLLILGNVAFRHFEPRMPLWKRAAKILVMLAVTAAISLLRQDRCADGDRCRADTGLLYSWILAATPWRELLDRRASRQILRAARLGRLPRGEAQCRSH